jgi:AcrR family transcriptional regulator
MHIVIATDPRPPGRPRDLRIDEALLRCAGEVMLERGYLATSISEIARRAGVGTPAIYRRWPNKAAIAIDLFVDVLGEEPLPDTGFMRQDLTAFMRLRIRQWTSPWFHQVVLHLLMEALIDNAVRSALAARIPTYRAPLIGRIRGWIAAGELRADTDPTQMLDLLMGTVALPLLFGQPLPQDSEAEAIVDLVLSGFATR